jgi:hypothetical protein
VGSRIDTSSDACPAKRYVHDLNCHLSPRAGAGGPGPNTLDLVPVLEQWVEHGVAPDQVIASHMTGSKIDRTRPLCAYPAIAVYKGSNDPDQAANWTCKTP